MVSNRSKRASNRASIACHQRQSMTARGWGGPTCRALAHRKSGKKEVASAAAPLWGVAAVGIGGRRCGAHGLHGGGQERFGPRGQQRSPRRR